MLKSFSTHNFIHFTKAQRLEFKAGANFFIGGNSTGKSAVLELIRRCLSNDINTTYSSFNVKHGIAYAVSQFEFPDDGISPKNGLHVTKKKIKHVIACIFVDTLHDEVHSVKPFSYYKVLCTMHPDNGTNVQAYVFVKRYKGDCASNTDALEPYEASMFYSEWEKRNLDNIMEHGSICDDAIRILFNEIKKKEFNTDHKCDEDMSEIYTLIEKRYVGVMPLRSIGPLQWTWSKRNQHKCREENYKIASDRAEILGELLGSNKLDEELEKKFCEALSLPCTFKKDDDGQIFVYFHDIPSVRRPLLKTPEGVLEAKQLALILSHKHLLTITLEEPDHGMHPHMVMKVREELLKKVPKNKTVLVTSHQSAILDHETMNNTYLFSERIENDNAGKCTILHHSVHTIPPDNKRFGCMEEMKQMLFSDMILLVPGYTDKIIIDAIFSLLINSKEHLNKMIGNDNQLIVDFRKYLLKIHVGEMHGETSGKNKKLFFDGIERGKKTFLLYDFDMVQLTKPPIRLISGKRIGVGTFDLDNLFFVSLEDLYNDQLSFKKFQNVCNNGQVFVWKYGSIEDVINQIESKMDSTLKSSLNIPIQVDKKRQLDLWKSMLAGRNYNDILALATALVDHSDEIERFLQFLILMKKQCD